MLRPHKRKVYGEQKGEDEEVGEAELEAPGGPGEGRLPVLPLENGGVELRVPPRRGGALEQQREAGREAGALGREGGGG